jgi:hypothetical protein
MTPGQFTADLVTAVAVRQFSASSIVLGIAFSQRTTGTGRAIVGGIDLNPDFAPTIADDERSHDRFFHSRLS